MKEWMGHHAAGDGMSTRSDEKLPVPEIVAAAVKQWRADGTVPAAYSDYVRGGAQSLQSIDESTVRLDPVK
jgi:hypothetical protein